MSNDLLDKAQALLEAREKADQREIMVADYISRRKDKPSPIRMLKTLPDKDRIAEAVKVNNAEFFAIAANTSAEIITGYQDIVREARNALNSAKSVLAACKMVAPQGSTENHSYLAVHGAWHRTRDTIARLDAAIPPSQHHTTMNSKHHTNTHPEQHHGTPYRLRSRQPHTLSKCLGLLPNRRSRSGKSR